MDLKKSIPEGEVVYTDEYGNELTERDFIIEFIKESKHNYTFDERLEKLMNNIPNVINKFGNFTSDEEFRTKVNSLDGSLDSILDKSAPENSYGYPIYKPFNSSDRDEYKKEFFVLFSYCLVFYSLYYDGAVYNFSMNGVIAKDFDVKISQLPHMLGLENAYVSSRPNALLEVIMPGYNAKKNVLDKMLFLLQNADKLIDYERTHNIDLFNYYKCMSKCKLFLMNGRVLADSDPKLTDKNKFAVMPHNTRNGKKQFYLLKKSNMNSKCDNNICKIILEEDQNGSLFVKSLQGLTDQLLRSNEYHTLLKKSPTMVTLGGVPANLNVSAANQIVVNVVKKEKLHSVGELIHTILDNPPLAPPPHDDVDLQENEHYQAVSDFLNYLGVECDGLEEYRYVDEYSDYVENDDDIEVLLDDEEDFQVNFDRHMNDLLDEMFAEIDVVPSEEKNVNKFK